MATFGGAVLLEDVGGFQLLAAIGFVSRWNLTLRKLSATARGNGTKHRCSGLRLVQQDAVAD